MPDPLSDFHQFHEAALDAAYALVRLQDVVVRYFKLSIQARRNVSASPLYVEHMAPFMDAIRKVPECPEDESMFRRMTVARVALMRAPLAFRNMQGANAHQLVLGVSLFFIRLWNRRARPEERENPPSTRAGPAHFVLYPPGAEMDLVAFMDEAHQCLGDYNPLSLHVELELEYVKATERLEPEKQNEGNLIQRNRDNWQLRYRNETGDYPVKGNQSIAWLAKLLATPNSALYVADLRGDPEGKLAADAKLGSEPEIDRDGIRAFKRELEELEELIATAGASESLLERKARLLQSMKSSSRGKTIGSSLKRDHSNMATQLRNLCRKLEKKMPHLASHLKACLKIQFPTIGYFPPEPAPNWQF